MKITSLPYFLSVITSLWLFSNLPVLGQAQKTISNLRGTWKFAIGDDKNRSNPNFDDSDWGNISVPSEWENEGYHGYNGYAWYRTTAYVPKMYQSTSIYFSIGYIDDVDEVYFNGRLIGGKGGFPPHYSTAYNQFREYIIPPSFIYFNKHNSIAIRVYDAELAGGILSGPVSLISKDTFLYPDFSLDGGDWKFSTGDDSVYKEKSFDDSRWNYMQVPAFWDNFGYSDYDGFAWYRKKFNPGSSLDGKKFVLMLGQIDDIDETYLNGILIGSTGKMDGFEPEVNNYDYKQFRGYFIPDGLIKPNAENIIAVRVYDGFKDGGIYSGPIGFVSQEKYVTFWKSHKPKKESFWQRFFNNR